ncbi:hypothetical protein J437_LFUL008191 [Ladona fulva]|uniref:DDE-1 domain-containing protein n=1 Tax=Ladona fulva TaxID=123851 RepID=A0A8K0NZ98_LADFU|nr:hypothetical protein J437_LFUL008191 [Ladona fulva]
MHEWNQDFKTTQDLVEMKNGVSYDFNDSVMGAQRWKILLFVDNCAAHPKDNPYLKNVKVLFYPPNCTSVLQPLDMGIIWCFKQLYRKQLVQRVVSLMDSGTNIEPSTFKINVLQAMHFVLSAWRQVSQTSITNCYKKCGYGDESSQNVSESMTSEENETFENDWNRLTQGLEGTFEDYVICDSELPTCGVDSIDALCEDKEEESGEEDAMHSRMPKIDRTGKTLITTKLPRLLMISTKAAAASIMQMP